jgi:hypothetical protein
MTLVWEDRDDDLFGTLLVVTLSRVIRVVGPRRPMASPASHPSGDDTVQAETWPLSRLRALRLACTGGPAGRIGTATVTPTAVPPAQRPQRAGAAGRHRQHVPDRPNPDQVRPQEQRL